MTSYHAPATPQSAYDSSAAERWVQEPPKPVTRGHFERDRARVMHSAALRRLSGKTQVHVAGSDDFVRNRLTHSLEVAQVGRELAKRVGCDPDVVDAACLAHDVGHPPFGHWGEQVLHGLSEDIGGFEGNAQSFRLLTRLEPKVMVPGASNRSAGLNLTRTSLDACTKYPWGHGGNPDKPHKFGFYEDDRAVFEWMRQGAPARRRSVETQVMDISDDIAYCVHDVEDAIVAGWVNPEDLNDTTHRDQVLAVALNYVPHREPTDVEAALGWLQEFPLWLPTFHHSRAHMAQLKDLTSQLIGHFAASVQRVVEGQPVSTPAVRYEADVALPPHVWDVIAVMKAIAAHFVMFTDDRQPEYDRQKLIITELVELYLRFGAAVMEPVFADDFRDAASDEQRRRVVIDQVAVLTDASATSTHAALTERYRGTV